ncbi:hypothetical protein GVX76_02540 [[Haemophilus] felis]|nr:hypothetical protein [[Haemophilus] felis]
MSNELKYDFSQPYQFLVLEHEENADTDAMLMDDDHFSKMEMLSHDEFVERTTQTKAQVAFLILNSSLDLELVKDFKQNAEHLYVVTLNDNINTDNYQAIVNGVIHLQAEQLPKFYQAILSMFINSGLIYIGKEDAINCLEHCISHLHSTELSVNHLEIELDQFVSKHEQNLAEATNLLIVLTTDTSLTLEQFVIITDTIRENAPNAKNIVVGTGLGVEQAENVFLVDVLAGK